MFNFFKLFKKKGFPISHELKKEIDLVIESINAFTKQKSNSDNFDLTEKLFDLEIQINDYFEKLNASIQNNYYLPYYWEDIYEVSLKIKKIFKLLVEFNENKKIVNNKINDNFLFEIEKTFLTNISLFFEFLDSNRSQAEKLLKNNDTQIVSFEKIFSEIKYKKLVNSFDSIKELSLIKIFDKINSENENIQNLLRKIVIWTKV